MRVLFIFLLVAFLSGCSSVPKKQAAHIATLIHTQKVAFESGRFDMAKRINAQLVTLTPAPKKAVVLHEFRVQNWGNGKGIFSKKEILSDRVYTVLPENTDIKNLIVNGSPEYKELLISQPSLVKRESENNKLINTLDKKTEDIKREKEALYEKQAARRWYDGIFGFFKGFGILGVLALIGLVVTAFLNPALFFGIINVGIRWVKALISFIVNLFSRGTG